MQANDDSVNLIERVKDAAQTQSPVRIVGGNSKAAIGNRTDASKSTELSTLNHTGVITYDPTELVVTVRSGTPLNQLNQVLSDAGQMLPFEPPVLPGATIGGVLACGLSGPRRPFSGSARDYVLGTRVINGQAQDLAFGGEVMKNVAGYDVSRVQIGAWGSLGVLLDISMKVLPKPELELTLKQSCKHDDLQAFPALMRQALPLSGAMLIDDHRYLRLSGSEAAVHAAASTLGGERLTDNEIWTSVRDHTHSFFTNAADAAAGAKSLWRISVADYAPPLALSGQWLYDWAGAQRWLITELPADEVFRITQACEGHATLYSVADADQSAFQPLSAGMQKLQSRVRDSFDPLRLFNRGRFHPELDTTPRLVATGA